MNRNLSPVPCVGSEQTYPIDGRLYGQSSDRGSRIPKSPDGSHEICGTESFQLPSPKDWLDDIASRD